MATSRHVMSSSLTTCTVVLQQMSLKCRCSSRPSHNASVCLLTAFSQLVTCIDCDAHLQREGKQEDRIICRDVAVRV